MLHTENTAQILVTEIKPEEAKKLLTIDGFISAVGHESTANLLTQILGLQVYMNRIPIKLEENDILIVFQLMTRIPEGKILTEEELANLEYKFFAVRYDPIKYFFY
jgi:hypothetical protein